MSLAHAEPAFLAPRRWPLLAASVLGSWKLEIWIGSSGEASQSRAAMQEHWPRRGARWGGKQPRHGSALSARLGPRCFIWSKAPKDTAMQRERMIKVCSGARPCADWPSVYTLHSCVKCGPRPRCQHGMGEAAKSRLVLPLDATGRQPLRKVARGQDPRSDREVQESSRTGRCERAVWWFGIVRMVWFEGPLAVTGEPE
ncbi:hypothetical protein B0J11DRAFT_54451 [Dendryphion nanum]|uniref:Uncharacterized protein n=1 Tax=Dendryphion nanum TaxID=256645 RepID=A0A9P9DL61_9PLEO|nr:hypothetical protein B0J11DRAFT_54451 [Dendryphion nanum]